MIERCGGCGFVASRWTRDDVLGTLRVLAGMWHAMTEGMPDSVLAARPASATWSAYEYAGHTRDVTDTMGRLMHFALTTDDARIDIPIPEPPQPRVAATIGTAIGEVDVACSRLFGEAVKLSETDWARTVTMDDQVADVTWLVTHAVHDATHHLRDVGRGLVALGAGAPTQHGRVAQVSASSGGVPKRPVPRAAVSVEGVEGDQQADRRNHGRAWQAVCLWSTEVIADMRAEGHSVRAGAAGENLTVSGIDWVTIRPGVRVRIGTTLLEISAFTEPCHKNAQWFLGGDFRRMQHARHPGVSRAYAWVLEPGEVAPGDVVVVEP